MKFYTIGIERSVLQKILKNLLEGIKLEINDTRVISFIVLCILFIHLL